MMLRRFIKYFVCALILSNWSADAQHVQATEVSTKSKKGQIILSKVKVVPEVKAFLQTTPKEDKPMLMIETDPDFKYYKVKLGISNKGMFRTTETFCVDPKTFEVYYWDVFADDISFSNLAIITLKDWRYWRTKPEWVKPHTWKAGKLVALTNQ